MSENWFRDWFDQDYLEVYAHRGARDAAAGVRLLLESVRPAPGDRALDVACGTGRHARLMAAAGLAVTALDLSAVLLAEAQRAGTAAGARVALVRGDQRSLPFAGSFDLVTSFFTSFGYFAAPRDDLRALRSMAGALRRGGHLLLDLMNPPHLEATFVPASRRRAGDLEIDERRRLEGGRVIKRIRLRRGDRERTLEESVRLYSEAELEALFARAGLDVIERFGSYEGDPVSRDQPRLVFVGRPR